MIKNSINQKKDYAFIEKKTKQTVLKKTYAVQTHVVQGPTLQTEFFKKGRPKSGAS